MTPDAATVYKCLSDPTRLRILNLLSNGPLCVCELQALLGETQVKISKHLLYLKRYGLVICEQRANWRYYNLSNDSSNLLEANLQLLRRSRDSNPQLANDLKRFKEERTASSCK